MALNDPQTLTIGEETVTLPRTSTGGDQSTYTAADQQVALQVAHSYQKRTRRMARASYDKITTDPLISGQNIRVGMSARIVVDVPKSGFSNAEIEDMISALGTWLTANKTQFAGGEN